MIVKIQNNLDQTSPFSFLSNGEASGAATARVKNINAFSASDAVQVGKSGEELSEVALLGTAVPSGTALTLLGTLRYDHATDTPIYDIKYDQVVFEVSTTGTAGTALPITGGTVTITPDSSETIYDHTSGLTTYAYKAYFRNSATFGTTSESDWLTSSGFSFYSLAKIRDRVKRKLFSASYIKDDQTINDWVNEWLETMVNGAINVNQDYLMGTLNVGFSGTAELGTITASDYKDVARVWYTTNGVDVYKAGKLKDRDIYPSQAFNETHPYYYFKGDNVIGRKPADASGTLQIDYYKLSPVLVNDADELPVSIRPYTKSFVDYGMAQAYSMDLKEGLAKSYNTEAQAGYGKFLSEITPRSMTGPTNVTLVASVDGDDNFSYN